MHDTSRLVHQIDSEQLFRRSHQILCFTGTVIFERGMHPILIFRLDVER